MLRLHVFAPLAVLVLHHLLGADLRDQRAHALNRVDSSRLLKELDLMAVGVRV